MKKFTIIFLFSALKVCTLLGQSISIGYLGNNIWNPGFEVKVAKTLKNLTYTSEFATFLDPGSHTAVFTNLGVEKSLRKWSVGAAPLGIYRSFLPNTYEVLDDQSIKDPRSIKGNFYFAPAFSLNRQHFEKLRSKVQIIILTPYNNSLMPIVNFGFSYQIKSEGKK